MSAKPYQGTVVAAERSQAEIDALRKVAEAALPALCALNRYIGSVHGSLAKNDGTLVADALSRALIEYFSVREASKEPAPVDISAWESKS